MDYSVYANMNTIHSLVLGAREVGMKLLKLPAEQNMCKKLD